MARNRYDPNPFDDGEEVNPFADQGGKTNYSGGSFYTSNVPSAPSSKLSPLPHEPADFYNDTYNIPLDSTADLKKKERELQAKEADLRRREEIVKRKEEAAARAGIVLEEKNWPPFFPIIHHDIANEIPIHLQKLQYVAFTTYLGMVFCLFWNIIATTTAWIKGEGKKVHLALVGSSCFTVGILPAIDLVGDQALVGIFYFIGFGFFCLEALLSIWVIQVGNLLAGQINSCIIERNHQVYMYFRGNGGAAEMRREGAR
ncbi:secretory carrier-associated membrane protein 2-like protein [Tanacetum coccineum]